MSTRFKKHRKKRGYLGACCDRIRKHKKYHGGRGNAGETEQYIIHFDKYHLGYLGKVRTRYLRKGKKLSGRERAGTSSIQYDIAEEVIREDEEEDFGVFDDCPFTEIKDKEEGNNEDQLFDKSPDINETVEIYSDKITNIQFQLCATSMTLNYVSKINSKLIPGDHRFILIQDYGEGEVLNCEIQENSEYDLDSVGSIFSDGPSDYGTLLAHINGDSEVLAEEDEGNFENSRSVSIDFAGICEIRYNPRAISLESVEVSSIFDEIEDNGSDFGDNEVAVEKDEKDIELKELDLETLERVLSLLQISGIVDESRQSSLKETGLFFIEEYWSVLVTVKLVPHFVDKRINEFEQNQVEHVDPNLLVQSIGRQQGVKGRILDIEHKHFQFGMIGQIDGSLEAIKQSLMSFCMLDQNSKLIFLRPNDVHLPATRCLILNNAKNFRVVCYPLAVIVKSETTHQYLTCAHALGELGLLITFSSSVVSGILLSPKVVACVSDGLGATYLNITRLERMKEMLALHFFVYLFTNKKYEATMNENVVLLKNSMDELLYHVSSLKGTGMDFLIEINNIASWDDDAYAKSSCKSSGAVGNGIAPQVEYYLGPLTISLTLSSSDKYMDVGGTLYHSQGFSGMSSDIDFLFPLVVFGIYKGKYQI